MMALFTVVLVVYLAVEISYETAIEYRVATADYQRLKAYYAAKSGVELSLLRIQLYQQVATQYKDQLKGQTQLLDLIWQFPFMWPPQPPASMTRVGKEEIKKSVGESFMDATFMTQISSEGGKIDINDVGSPSEGLRKSARQQLTQLIKNRLDQDDDWARNSRGLQPDEIVNDIQDWVDSDAESLNGGAEEGRYPDFNSTFIPPNQAFKTLEELHMVRGITDELFAAIAPNVTVYGLKGINVNYAEKGVLRSIDPQITDEIADDILKRRGDPLIGPFKDENDYTGFLASQRVDMTKFNPEKIPLYFDAEYNFRIRSIGQFGNSTREIIAVVYDFDTVRDRFEKLLTTGSTTTTTTVPGQNPASGAAVTPATTTTTVPPTSAKAKGGPPNIIYWYEE